MAHALELLFDAAADAEIRDRWKRLEAAGIRSLASGNPPQRPHVTLAVGSNIPAKARKELRAELKPLSLPDLWLSTLGTFTDESEAVLFLGAVVDTEVLAVHSSVHDVLAGKVTNPSACCFPGAWIPHCTLAKDLTTEQLSTAFAALQPPERVRARIAHVAVVDTRTGEADLLLDQD